LLFQLAQHATRNLTRFIMARAIMLQGTGSDVGKTVLVAGLCRLAKKRGLRVAPFKPQNMSNNAAVALIPETGGFGEIGRAQWLQALACGVAPTVHMNPVLLKPQSATGSQIIVQGKVFGTAKGRDYQRLKPQLLGAVLDSFEKLKADYDLIIVEGAGSPAEVNLRAGDIANMGFARAANVPVVLVGDIDRGGVIASLVGTKAILQQDDAAMISGYIINKFRGDVSLFDDGLKVITEHTGWPSLGVVPWLKSAAKLPAEDSVALERLVTPLANANAKIVAVPVYGRIANFDDLDPLVHDPAFDIRFIRNGERLPLDASVVVLPGSKATISDLAELRANSWDKDIAALFAKGAEIIGICGGYQMLGKTIADPIGLEGNTATVSGLGLLDVHTIMAPEKTVREVSAFAPALKANVTGYEIHLGETSGPDCERPTAIIDGRNDGARSQNGKIWGTYLHGGTMLAAHVGAMAGESRMLADQALDEIADELAYLLDASWLDVLFSAET
jgi:adenosylcobyric acid synthase